MPAEQLHDEVCRECGCAIRVAKYSPHPLEKEATGMSASRWDGVRQDFYFVGWICNKCAFASAMREGGGSVAGGGGDDFEFCY